MDHYKSWAGLNKWLGECLCDELKGRITYFLTRYHKVHDSYGRGAILLDGRELVCFSWIEQYRQEADGYSQEKKPEWDANCTYCEWDFLKAVLEFRNLSIQDALASGDYIIKILAILDKRVGKRTLEKIRQAEEYKQYPDWARQFYELRLGKTES